VPGNDACLSEQFSPTDQRGDSSGSLLKYLHVRVDLVGNLLLPEIEVQAMLADVVT
jgi:hypothetical protein